MGFFWCLVLCIFLVLIEVSSTTTELYIEFTGQSLLISSLPGKVLRTFVEIARLADRFNMRSQS